MAISLSLGVEIGRRSPFRAERIDHQAADVSGIAVNTFVHRSERLQSETWEIHPATIIVSLGWAGRLPMGRCSEDVVLGRPTTTQFPSRCRSRLLRRRQTACGRPEKRVRVNRQENQGIRTMAPASGSTISIPVMPLWPFFPDRAGPAAPGSHRRPPGRIRKRLGVRLGGLGRRGDLQRRRSLSSTSPIDFRHQTAPAGSPHRLERKACLCLESLVINPSAFPVR